MRQPFLHVEKRFGSRELHTRITRFFWAFMASKAVVSGSGASMLGSAFDMEGRANGDEGPKIRTALGIAGLV